MMTGFVKLVHSLNNIIVKNIDETSLLQPKHNTEGVPVPVVKCFSW